MGVSHLNRRHGCENNWLGSLRLPGRQVIPARPVTQSQQKERFLPAAQLEIFGGKAAWLPVPRPSILAPCPASLRLSACSCPFLSGRRGGMLAHAGRCRARPQCEQECGVSLSPTGPGAASRCRGVVGLKVVCVGRDLGAPWSHTLQQVHGVRSLRPSPSHVLNAFKAGHDCPRRNSFFPNI